jgi:hypothetical protein
MSLQKESAPESRHNTKNLWSGVGDWAAPVLVGATFIAMLAAMISVLLGPDR